MRKDDDYKDDGYEDEDWDWLLSKIPGWKTYSSIRASWRAVLAYYKRVRGVLAGIPPYLRSNKRHIAKYTTLYLFVWAAEWFLGLPVEFTILGGGACCLVIDLYIKFLRPFKPTSALSSLRRRAYLKKKSFKRQKVSFVIWSTFYVGAGRFLANPALRIVKTKAAGLFRYLWLAAFVDAFLDFILFPPLVAWSGQVQPTYPDQERLMGLMVSGPFIDNGLDYTQSHLINWLLSLVVFIILISQTTLIEGQDPSPYIRSAFKKLLVTSIIIFCLEALKASTLDFILINYLHSHTGDAIIAYALIPILWWLVYLRTFEYLAKRGGRASTVVFNSLADLNPDHDFRRNTALLRLFISRAPLAVAFAVFCFCYLAVKTLSLLAAGLDWPL